MTMDDVVKDKTQTDKRNTATGLRGKNIDVTPLTVLTVRPKHPRTFSSGSLSVGLCVCFSVFQYTGA